MSIHGKVLSNILEFPSPDADKIRCAICGNPVLLSESVADENGKTVHSECYLKTLIEATPTRLIPSNPADYLLET